MKRAGKIFAGSLLLLGSLTVCGVARAWGHVGVFIGIPPYAPWYVPYAYPYPVYPAPYYPPVVAVEPPPATVAPPPPETQYWYYCPDSKGYYPYVSECPSGWRKVAPRPAPPPASAPPPPSR